MTEFRSLQLAQNFTDCPSLGHTLIQLCGKFEESGTFESRDMGLCDPKNCPFPVFARISRVPIFTIGPKFHRLSVSRQNNCVEILKKVGFSSLEIWVLTPKNTPSLCLQGYLEFGSLQWPKISPIVRLPAIQLCGKCEESGTFESRDMGLFDPQNGPFPVFARISRVRIFTIGPKFHRLSVSRP